MAQGGQAKTTAMVEHCERLTGIESRAARKRGRDGQAMGMQLRLVVCAVADVGPVSIRRLLEHLTHAASLQRPVGPGAH